MEVVLTPIAMGAVLTLVMDFLRLILKLEGRALMVATCVVSVVFGVVIYAMHNDAQVAQLVAQILLVLGTSQTVYNMIWKDQGLRKDLFLGK